MRHLGIRERVIIQYSIEHEGSLTARSLAQSLGTHPATIYREVLRQRISEGSKIKRFLHQAPLPCAKLKRFPYVCNACIHHSKCSKECFVYDAYLADEQARISLHDTRSHPMLNAHELKVLDGLVSARVKAHQSLYHILASEPLITISESTLRRYIDKRYLDAQNIDLPRTIRFPVSQSSHKEARKRIRIEFLVNRTYSDFKDYTLTKHRVILQLDTVVGSKHDHRALLTLYETQSKFQWGYMVNRSAASVNAVLSALIQTLTSQHHLFFDCLLTDNGAEFQSLPQLEVSDLGEVYCRVFYCDPNAAYQKGGCERNHSLIRYVLKKGESLDQVSQDEINLLFSHINSQKRKSLSGKTPFQSFREHFRFDPSAFVNVTEIVPSNLKLK